jgi:outer membrane protein TolC
MIRFHFITWTLCLFSLSACGSLFKPAAPQAAVPAKFAAAPVQTTPLEIAPQWWTVFNDPVLNDLQTQMLQGQLNVQLLASKVRQAQAAVAVSRTTSVWSHR